VEEKRNLSPSERIKGFAFGLAFFEESAEKIIRACSSLGPVKRVRKGKGRKTSQGNSLEVISENLEPDLFETPKEIRQIPVKFGNTALKSIKETYVPNCGYCGKTAKYQDNFGKGFSQSGVEYSNLVNYQEVSDVEVKTLFIKEVSTFKF